MIVRRHLPTFLLAAIAFVTPAFPALAENEPAELTQARTQFQREIDFTTRPIRDRYVARLELLKRGYGSRGDAKAAIILQDEIDRVKAAVADVPGVAKFAGVWHITYETTGTRRYEIKPDGTVIWSEDNGKPYGPRKAKITAKGSEFVLDFKEDPALERLSMTKGSLTVEYFAPKANFPGKAPQSKGVGTLLSPN